MEGVRRGARAVMKWFAPLMVVLIVVQILLAGEGIFGIKKGPKLDDQKTLDPHRFLGGQSSRDRGRAGHPRVRGVLACGGDADRSPRAQHRRQPC